MNLKLQIFSLVFSFFYGVVFSILTNINYKYIFNQKKVIKILFTLIFVLSMAIFYFYIINIINDGIIHLYFLLIILVGFYITFPFSKNLRSCKK